MSLIAFVAVFAFFDSRSVREVLDCVKVFVCACRA